MGQLRNAIELKLIKRTYSIYVIMKNVNRKITIIFRTDLNIIKIE